MRRTLPLFLPTQLREGKLEGQKKTFFNCHIVVHQWLWRWQIPCHFSVCRVETSFPSCSSGCRYYGYNRRNGTYILTYTVGDDPSPLFTHSTQLSPIYKNSMKMCSFYFCLLICSFPSTYLTLSFNFIPLLDPSLIHSACLISSTHIHYPLFTVE